MNRKHERVTAENGEYAVRSSRRRDIVAAAVCLLLALVVWLFVMNADDTASISLTPQGGEQAFTYTLSAENLEVAGRVMAIKGAKREGIVVKIPVNATTPGVYAITLEDLVLPDGVALTTLPDLTLTVSAK